MGLGSIRLLGLQKATDAINAAAANLASLPSAPAPHFVTGYSAVPSSDTPQDATPTSSVDTTAELTKMIDASRTYEAFCSALKMSRALPDEDLHRILYEQALWHELMQEVLHMGQKVPAGDQASA